MDGELRQYLKVLRKRYLLFAAVLFSCIGVSGALTHTTEPIYRAEAKLFVGQRQISTADVASGRTVTDLSAKLLKSYAAIIETHPITALAIDAASLPQDARTLSKAITAEPITDTQIILLSYRSSDPGLAQRTVNAVARAFVAEVEKLDAPREVRDEEPAVKVAVVEPALVPNEPVEPKIIRNYALAVILGAVLGFGLAFLVDHFDTRIKEKEDIEQELRTPVLASIPRIQTRSEELYLEGDNQSVFAETFRKLRTAIQLYGAETEHRTILVSSPRAREGKSTTAINLAAVYAYSGNRTILVEADMRRPKLHEHFSTSELNGFTLALLGRIPLDQAILPTSIPNLSCSPAGAIPPNPAELLSSRNMRALLDELRVRYDTVVIDAPPLLPVADATTVAPRVDGVLVVAKVKQTLRDELKESVELVRAVGGNLLGIVLNAVPMDLAASDYSYYDDEVRARSRRGLFARN